MTSKRKQHPSQARLRELFDYDPEGFLVWKYNPDRQKKWNSRYPGERAGCISVNKKLQSCYVIRIEGQLYNGQSLIWIYHNGDIPKGKTVNRIDSLGGLSIENLCLSDWNKRSRLGGMHISKNPSGFIGVYEADHGRYFWSGKSKQRCFFNKHDAAVFYDNIIEEEKGFRPNFTERSKISPIPQSLIAHISFASKAKKEGSLIGVEEKYGAKGKVYRSKLRREYLGTFDTKEAAARAYNIAAYEHYGEHAILNDIPDPLGKLEASKEEDVF